MPGPRPEGPEELRSEPLAPEEQFHLECAMKEPVEGIQRIEEAAKFLIGATVTTSGLFVAAFKLAKGEETVSWIAGYLPFLAWAASICALTLVLLPMKYQAGRAVPADWKEAFLHARRWKYGCLWTGAVFFLLGVCAALYPF